MAEPASCSVVVASFRGLDLLTQCLESLRPQCAALGAELVVARAVQEPADRLGPVTEGCRLVTCSGDADVPRLRGHGLAQAGGEWVALTEDHCVADPGWLAALLAGAGPDVQVLGGSMGNARRERATDCGAFFAEYGFFGANRRADPPGALPLVTGANVAYHRTVVGEVAAWATEGSWENVIHQRLSASGHRFRLVPGARVRQNQTYRLAGFCRDRFDHGRDFAATRAVGLPAWRRAVLCAGTPALPPILGARIARSVDAEERKYFGKALPATLTFLSAWALGEATGYALGAAPQ